MFCPRTPPCRHAMVMPNSNNVPVFGSFRPVSPVSARFRLCFACFRPIFFHPRTPLATVFGLVCVSAGACVVPWRVCLFWLSGLCGVCVRVGVVCVCVGARLDVVFGQKLCDKFRETQLSFVRIATRACFTLRRAQVPPVSPGRKRARLHRRAKHFNVFLSFFRKKKKQPSGFAWPRPCERTNEKHIG